MELAGKRILIAGASRGIGAAAVADFAASGAQLAIGARDAEALAGIAANHPTVRFHAPCDFTDPAAMAKWVTSAEAALGGIDGLLVTLTAGRPSSSPADIAASLETDFTTPVTLFRACLPALQHSRGAALFCSSRTAAKALPQTMAYGAAKAALEYATRCLAAETAAQGLRVNAIALGSTLTEDGFWAKERATDSPLWRKTLWQMPQGRMADPAEILAPMRFLLSDHARWITGQILLVDGGQNLVQPELS